LKLKLSNDRKVTPLATFTKSKGWTPKVPNSFGLPAIDSCPDATEWCMGICYALRLQTAWTSVDNLVRHNLEVLRSAGNNVKKMTAMLVEAIESINWRGTTPVFRWQWNGDIFSKTYAAAIAETCKAFPDIQFWLYTRSFDYIPLIADIPNLTVYLSIDTHNIDEGKRTYESIPGLWVAACADDWDTSEDIMRQVVGRNAPRCPELTGKLPLVTENGEGACVACGMCIYGRNHVRFASDH